MNNNTKKILSFDVGIKNLAYCVIEKNILENNFKILNWGIINLLENDVKCMYILKGGKKCDNQANFNLSSKDGELIFPNETNNFLCCNTHKEKSVPQIVKYDWKKNKNNEIHPICLYCNNFAEYFISTNNYCGYCEEHFIKYSKKFPKNICQKKITVMNCDDFPLLDLGKILFQKLATFGDFLKVDEVLIENQPGRLQGRIKVGNKIKTIASFIFSYFILKGILENNISDVKFISASNKLKIDSKTTNSIIKNKKNIIDNVKETKKNYDLTKNLGKEYCKTLITPQDMEILDKYKKKDDMCDAFLQGFQYLFNPVPEKYINMLKNVDLTFSKKK